MPPADLSAWERAGPLLAARRVQISPRYGVRRAFARDTGLNWRTLHDAENAKRANFKAETLRQFESAYRLVPGSLDRTLAGGDLEPAPVTEPARPPLAAVPPLPVLPDEPTDQQVAAFIMQQQDEDLLLLMWKAWTLLPERVPRRERLRMVRDLSLDPEVIEAGDGEEEGHREEQPRREQA